MKAVSVSIVLAVLLSLVLASEARQGHAPAKPATSTQNPQGLGVVAGRVFAITKSGDLKPCRLCKIYFLFQLPIVGQQVVDSKVETPGSVFLANHVKELDELIAERKAESARSVSDELWCKKELLGNTRAIADTFEQADQHNPNYPDLFH